MRQGGGRCNCVCCLLVCVLVFSCVCETAHEERPPSCPIVALEFQYCYVLFDLYPQGIWRADVSMCVCV